jgi:RpiR family carbohydrate utilization transcriptional regulator
MTITPTASPSRGGTAILARLGALAEDLREAERKIGAYVVAHPADVVHQSVTELADRTDTSEATVIRFAQRLGFPGYAALKIALALELNDDAIDPSEELPAGDSAQVKRRVLRVNVESLQDTADVLDDASLAATVDALVAARRIEVYGVGTSAAMAQLAYALLLQVGLPIVAVTDPHWQIESAIQLRAGDVALAISNSGSTRDTVESLQTAREAGATCVCLTNHARSPIAKVAHLTLLAAARPATVGGHQLLGRVAQLAVLDILAAAALLRRQGPGIDALARGRRAVSSSKKY